MRRAVLVVAALAAVAPPTVAAGSPSLVPAGALLAAGSNGRLAALDRSGHVLRRFGPQRPGCCQAIDLAADRRHAFVAVRGQTQTALLDVDLATGGSVRIGVGASPALSPDRRRLASFSISTRDEVRYRTSVVIRDLATGRSRAIPFRRRTSWDTPPEVLINWSPDGRRLAVVDGDRRIRIVDVATARSVESQPKLAAGLSAPVFLDDHTLVALANCCIGPQQLVTVDLASVDQRPFATLPEPPESLRRIGAGSFAATTPDGFLLVFTRGNVRRVATGYFAVSG